MERRLVLAREAKLASLLPDAGGRLEASGVLAGGGRCYVIFDNAPDIARIPATLAPADGPDLIRQPRGRRDGFEDIAHDPATGRFYVLVEARARGQGFMAEVQEYDERLGYLGRAWLQFPLDSLNKGLEGLTCARRHGRPFLLGLCEGNRCRDGAEGRRPGGGRVQVFERGRRHWDRVATIRLPATLPLRGLQQPGRGRRPPGRALAGLRGAVGRPGPSFQLGGGRPGRRVVVPSRPGGPDGVLQHRGGVVAVARHRGGGIRQG